MIALRAGGSCAFEEFDTGTEEMLLVLPVTPESRCCAFSASLPSEANYMAHIISSRTKVPGKVWDGTHMQGVSHLPEVERGDCGTTLTPSTHLLIENTDERP